MKFYLKCPDYRGVSLCVRTTEVCPYYRGMSLLQKCPYYRGVLL